MKYDYSIVHSDDNNSVNKILSWIAPNSTVLEFGCANGRMTRYMSEHLQCQVSIVEIDQLAYEQALQYASDGICCDISQYDWLEKFQGQQFDYILFADVLEHLYSPDEVLNKAGSLLAEGGFVYVSLPNLAHNDVLLQLYHNNFRYSDVGLLDNTHIRFFAYHELNAFFEKAGFSVVLEDATTCDMFLTEQKAEARPEDELFIRSLQDRGLKSVYQFVYKLQKTEYVKKNFIAAESRLPDKENGLVSKFYFNTGSSLAEENSLYIHPACSKGGYYYYEVPCCPGAVSVRFDPLEGSFCIIKDMQVLSDGGLLEATPICAEKIGEYTVFCNTDPQYLIDFKGATVTMLTIKIGSLISVDGMAMCAFLSTLLLMGKGLQEGQQINAQKSQKQIEAAQEKIQQAQEQLEQARRLAEEQKAAHHQLEEQLRNQMEEQLQNQLNEQAQGHARELNIIQEELTDARRKLQESAVQQSGLLRQLQETKASFDQQVAHFRDTLMVERDGYRNQYLAIANSSAWKLTKPLRVLLDLIKKLMKSNPVTGLLYKGLFSLRYNGMKGTLRILKRKINYCSDNWDFIVGHLVPSHDLEIQRKIEFEGKVKFSILTPLYNTPKQYLIDMLRSVMGQSYGDWELCLADGSDKKHSYVRAICRKFAKKDGRIKYQKLAQNEGIVGNSNACIKMATGNYICLLDHDDILNPMALFEMRKAIAEQGADFLYSDETSFSGDIRNQINPNYKPDFSIDTLRSINYICHLTAFAKPLLDEVGGFRYECDGSQDYDMVLRLTEKAACIVHIPKILYYWRAHEASVAMDANSKPYAIDSAKRAISDHLARVGLEGEVLSSRVPTTYKIKYPIHGEPLISIIIPNKDHVPDLKMCIGSIFEKSTYRNFEIIVVENNSEEEKTEYYYTALQKENDNVRVVKWGGKFNYSAIVNFGAQHAKGDYYLLLNNDIEVITPEWIEEMLMFAQRSDVGAVGAKLYYPDGTIQHAGVIMGIQGIAGHSHRYFPGASYGYVGRLTYAQNVSGVTGACMLVPRTVYEEVGGLNEAFEVAFNDVDFCLKIRDKGYLIIFTPYAELNHYESKSRGDDNTPSNIKRFRREINLFKKVWDKVLRNGDPYYNPNLTLEREDFSLR